MSGSERVSAGAGVPTDRITEAALRARDGDRGAARDLVAATQRDVWLLLVHLSDRQVAEDLAQETFERAFSSLHRFRGDSSARTWLLSIARRVAADHLRTARRRPRVVETLDTTDADGTTPHRRDDDHAGAVALRLDLDTLDADRRDALVVTQLIGLSYQEAAEVLDCPVGTIRSRVARARADLVAGLDG